MNFHFISLHPQLVRAFSKEGLVKRAIENSHIKLSAVDLRRFGLGKHRRVDDKPYGGGAGMLLRPEPIVSALRSLEELPKSRVIVFSAKGRKFSQKSCQRLLKYENLIFICGRYEGIDQRVIDHYADEEMRVGDYVLMGGELAGFIVVETLSRHIPGVLGNESSRLEESFTKNFAKEYPQYTRPPEFEGHKVPKVLLSGDHEEVRKWRKS